MQSAQPSPINIPIQFTIQPAVQQESTQKPPQSTLDRFFGQDFVTVLVIVAFLVVVIAVAMKKKWDAGSVRVLSITSIVFIGVFAALTVDNERNAAAVFALLGTVAGYILGKSERNARKDQGDQTSQNIDTT
jgi:cytochrome c biogenesis factor